MLLPGQPDAIQMTPGTTRANLHKFLWQKQTRRYCSSRCNKHLEEETGTEGRILYARRYGERCCPAGCRRVVTFLFAGYDTDAQEAENLQTLARIAAESREYGIPFIVEPLAIQKGANVVRDFEIMKLIIRMASEIGADLIKADFPESKKQFQELIGVSSVPILVRGGPKMDSDREMLQMVKDAIDCGAKGNCLWTQCLAA